ncbi:response regulator [Aliifodinibius salipaludis]|nr:response regulator [Aliifodinibius salipaludis]
MEPQSILIVDQQEVVRDSLQLILSEEGFRCYTSCNARKAQNVLTTKAVDLIIVDSQLLDRNGLFSFLRARYPTIKIIVMSSYVEIEVTQKALIDGAHDFVIKPLDFKELIDKINYHLSVVRS